MTFHTLFYRYFYITQAKSIPFSAMNFEHLRKQLFGTEGYKGNGWQMSMAEGSALVALLRHFKPRTSIEIGTAEGGSLGIIANHSEKVYSVDINPDCAANLSPLFPNTEFLTGNSADLLPPLFSRDNNIDFVLVDGDHTYAGAKKDIEIVLRHTAGRNCCIVMHDSFNPAVRRAILDINWESFPHVSYLDLDFVPGFMNSVSGCEETLWGGLSLCLISEKPRETTWLNIDQVCSLQFAKLEPRHIEVCKSRNLHEWY